MDNALELFYSNAQFTLEKRFSDAKYEDHFIIEDLLDFPNDEGTAVAVDGRLEAAMAGTSTDSSTVMDVENSHNSLFSAANTTEPGHFRTADVSGHFSGELCVPYNDLAELEWLSNFVEESFSSEDLQKLQPEIKARTSEPSDSHQYQFQPVITQTSPVLRPEVSVPAKARSKRSRAAPGNWASRLLVVSSSSESEIAAAKPAAARPASQMKMELGLENSAGEGRKCLHCATDKTPQWRTGPMGPKTLCNACGVRYKSGRLVAEYRPAASPTFVLTRHSNSHRKVLELRRQKEMLRAQQPFLNHHHHHHQNMMFDVSNGDDYLIHQHIGPDFSQLI